MCSSDLADVCTHTRVPVGACVHSARTDDMFPGGLQCQSSGTLTTEIHTTDVAPGTREREKDDPRSHEDPLGSTSLALAWAGLRFGLELNLCVATHTHCMHTRTLPTATHN